MDGPPKIPVGRRGRGRAQPRLAEPDEHAPLNVSLDVYLFHHM